MTTICAVCLHCDMYMVGGDTYEPILQTEYEGVLNLISAAKNQGDVKKVKIQTGFAMQCLVSVCVSSLLNSRKILSFDRL